MPEPIPFRQANMVMKAPPGEKNCDDLHVHRCDQSNQFISKWRLTTKEIEEISKHGFFWISVRGTIHPPIGFYTEEPFVPTEGG